MEVQNLLYSLLKWTIYKQNMKYKTVLFTEWLSTGWLDTHLIKSLLHSFLKMIVKFNVHVRCTTFEYNILTVYIITCIYIPY